jgi:hypothetical protein
MVEDMMFSIGAIRKFRIQLMSTNGMRSLCMVQPRLNLLTEQGSRIDHGLPTVAQRVKHAEGYQSVHM